MNRNKMNLQQKKTHVRVFQEFLIIASFTKLKLFAKSAFCHPKPAVETRYGERLLLSIQK